VAKISSAGKADESVVVFLLIDLGPRAHNLSAVVIDSFDLGGKHDSSKSRPDAWTFSLFENNATLSFRNLLTL